MVVRRGELVNSMSPMSHNLGEVVETLNSCDIGDDIKFNLILSPISWGGERVKTLNSISSPMSHANWARSLPVSEKPCDLITLPLRDIRDQYVGRQRD